MQIRKIYNIIKINNLNETILNDYSELDSLNNLYISNQNHIISIQSDVINKLSTIPKSNNSSEKPDWLYLTIASIISLLTGIILNNNIK